MLNPLEIFDLASEPDGVLIQTETRSFTRSELLGRGAALAESLEHVGIAEDDRVIVSLDSGPYFVAALIGCWLRGAIPVLLDPLVRREMDRAASLTGAKIVIRGGTDQSNCSKLAGIIPGEDMAKPVDVPLIDDDSPILYLFTSGSTGEPTLVPKSYEQLDVEVRFLNGLFDSPKRVATMAPWCHIFGLLVSCLLPARTRGICELSAGISPKKMLEMAATSRVDLVVFVPAVIQVMIKYLEAGGIPQIPKTCRFVSSGAPLMPALRSKFTALAGSPITDLYGSTEAGGVAYRHNDGPWLVEPHVETRIADGGFLEVRSNSVSICEEDGFYRIGDIVRLEGDGFILESRSDDVVKIGGRRTSLREVTEVLEECPEVSAAACLALKVRGAIRLVAFVETSKDSVKAESIRSFVRTRLADHKVPRVVRVVSALPRTPAGKIDKRMLEEILTRGSK